MLASSASGISIRLHLYYESVPLSCSRVLTWAGVNFQLPSHWECLTTLPCVKLLLISNILPYIHGYWRRTPLSLCISTNQMGVTHSVWSRFQHVYRSAMARMRCNGKPSVCCKARFLVAMGKRHQFLPVPGCHSTVIRRRMPQVHSCSLGLVATIALQHDETRLVLSWEI